MITIIWPEFITLNDWTAQLIADYPEEYLPILVDEEKWQDWANIVINTGVFAKVKIPPPFSMSEGSKVQNFKKWQDWAKVVYSIMIDVDKLK